MVNTKRIDPEGMTASPNLEEGKSTTCPSRFNDMCYWWWKTRMHDYIMAKDSELCDLVLNGPYIPTKNVKEIDLTQEVPKCRREYDEIDRKKKKSVALKVSHNDASEDKEEIIYLTERGFQEEGNSNRTENANDLYQKCGKSGNFMRDCQSHKHEFQDFKERRRDQVPDHAKRKANVDHVVRKAFAVWGNASSYSEEGEPHEDVSMMAVKDNEDIFNSIFSLTAKTDDEDDKNEVTLLDLKGDIDTLSIKSLRKLPIVLIDSVDELTNEKMVLSENLDLCQDEKSAIISQMSEMNVRLSMIETEGCQHKEEPETSKNGKRKLSSFELHIEESLKISDSKLVVVLEGNP
ncbi:hypothetical protein KY285_013250 [Solanum tuberosum]|nr:hypothetical protein KY285_013250 [Solanum tuberosum]